MEINATSQLDMLANQLDNNAVEAPAAVPEAADIAAFTRAMFGKENKTPEEVAVTGLQSKSLAVGDAVEGARATAEIINNPETMMKAKSALSKATLEVELIAKISGSLSQGINKLTSMQ
ncbi:EscI/YscI/HrpB family type III secretion system inner rod protein [Rahnella sp. SAP-1]|uniref:EscI/YscI/HrpB family type III secretion system inner rod protein n=1 Tax=Rouxiella aceris TaxID=2703884 RepID=A0A848MH46_9GAMM|nr:type III secretion system inner rod subunit SctI [Rouxiella aceris]NMP26473.1 EscI/YscI/HrpB family type III secretion system inner rod protein [Rouxiella aceris]